MSLPPFTIAEQVRRLRTGETTAVELMEDALSAASEHRNTNAFISLNPRALSDAVAADAMGFPKNASDRPLHGVPISVKDIFDVAGLPTTCGSAFPELQTRLADRDSAYVEAWRGAGAIIVGKTHLNEFAYGLTGENKTYGPCLQPRDRGLLTGGSSSGAAASVQAGSAMIGLGTDTGGSIRVPSALCGLVGFRHCPSADWNRGMFPLAPSFDTCGWLQQNLSDLPLVYSAVCPGEPAPLSPSELRIGFLEGEWLAVCDTSILSAYRELHEKLRDWGAVVAWKKNADFAKCPEIFSAIQAHEAAQVHSEFLGRPDLAYDPVIRGRLEWGLSLTKEEVAAKREEMAAHGFHLDALWQEHEFLIAPASPFEKLSADEDHTVHRRALLQMTTPFSLAGLPALTFPWGPESKKYGWQIVARRGHDHRLISLAKGLSTFLSSEIP